MSKMLKANVLTASFCLISGCSALIDDPIYHSVTRDFDTKKLNNETRSYQIAWLAQALLEPKTRQDVAKGLVENAPKIDVNGGLTLGDAADASLAAQMAADLLSGQLSSGLGGQLGTAVFLGAAALSLFSGDGSINTTSVVLLPEEFNGKTLDSSEKAKIAAEKLLVERYAKAAEGMGYSFKCEYECDAFPSLYRIQRLPETDVKQYIYAPEDIAIYFSDFDLIQPENTAALDSLSTGFNVAWRTAFGNAAAIFMIQKPRLDEHGHIEIISTDKMPSGWSIAGDGRFIKTDFGEAFLRQVHNTPFTIFGTSEAYPNVAYYNGAVYRYVLNSNAKTFNEIVMPRSLN